MTKETIAYEKTILVLNSCINKEQFACAQIYASLYLKQFNHEWHTACINDEIIYMKLKIAKHEA